MTGMCLRTSCMSGSQFLVIGLQKCLAPVAWGKSIALMTHAWNAMSR